MYLPRERRKEKNIQTNEKTCFRMRYTIIHSVFSYKLIFLIELLLKA